MKQCWVQYEKNKKIPPKKYFKKRLRFIKKKFVFGRGGGQCLYRCKSEIHTEIVPAPGIIQKQPVQKKNVQFLSILEVCFENKQERKKA